MKLLWLLGITKALATDVTIGWVQEPDLFYRISISEQTSTNVWSAFKTTFVGATNEATFNLRVGTSYKLYGTAESVGAISSPSTNFFFTVVIPPPVGFYKK